MGKFEVMLMEVRKFEARNGIEMVLQESLPQSDGKREADAFERLGLSKATYKTLGVAKPVALGETKADAKVVVPDAERQKLFEAFGGEAGTPENQLDKLARAL